MGNNNELQGVGPLQNSNNSNPSVALAQSNKENLTPENVSTQADVNNVNHEEVSGVSTQENSDDINLLNTKDVLPQNDDIGTNNNVGILDDSLKTSLSGNTLKNNEIEPQTPIELDQETVLQEPLKKRKIKINTGFLNGLNKKNLVIAICSVLCLTLFGILGWNIIKNNALKSEIKDIAITNITESSVSIVWTTQSPVASEVFYSDVNEWSPLTDVFKKSVSYDDRDMQEVEYGVFELDKKNNYYSHHVTIRGLEPEKTYYYKIKNGIFSINLGEQSFTTYAISEKVGTPFPVYGSVYDERAVKNSDILVLTYIKNLDGSSSQIISTVTEMGKGWSLDLGSVRDNLGNTFVKEDGWLVNVKAVTNKSEIVAEYENDMLAPTPDIVLPQVVYQSSKSEELGNSFSFLMSNQKIFAAGCTNLSQDICDIKTRCTWNGIRCIEDASDTGSCGDGECVDEDIYCGNGKCNWWESEKSCPDDCEDEEEEEEIPVCGNSVCEKRENSTGCPQDCIDETGTEPSN